MKISYIISSIRLKGYDYLQAGMYFVTICVQNRACLFGEIIDGNMVLNDAGKLLKNGIWNYRINFRTL